MSTLTRRDRVALGSTQGGALYRGDKRRWPESSPGVFEMFATHPGSSQRAANDYYGHCILGLTVSDLDGTPKIYSGYGSINVNVTPVYVWPLRLNGVWDATYVHSFNAYSLQHYQRYEGKLWCVAGDGPMDFCTGSPGGSWVDGLCAPTTFVHPFMIARHDGYTWVCGQYNGNRGGVWRGQHPTGDDGEFVFDDFPAGETLNRPITLFPYQSKLWYQAAYTTNAATSRLRYWDEPTRTFVSTSLRLSGYANIVRPWKTVMLSTGGTAAVERFDGTAVTKVYNPSNLVWVDGIPTLIELPQIIDMCVTPDDTVWILDAAGVLRRSTDLVTWTVWGKHVGALSFTVDGNFVYVGDNRDHIWRAKVAA